MAYQHIVAQENYTPRKDYLQAHIGLNRAFFL